MVKRFYGILVLCTLFLTVAVQAFAQDGVQLQYKFVPNQLLRYKVSMTTTTNIASVQGAGAIPVTMTSVLRQRVKKVLPNGDAEVAMAYESMKMDMMGNEIPTDVTKLPVMTITMSPAGAIKKTSGMERMPNAGQMGNLGNFVTSAALPLTPVKVGDKWTQTIQFPVFGTLKLDSELTDSDTKTATIKQSVNGDFDASSLMPTGNESLHPKGNMAMNSNVQFSVTEGCIVRTQANGTIAMTIETPNNQGTMKLDTTMDMTMELIADK